MCEEEVSWLHAFTGNVAWLYHQMAVASVNNPMTVMHLNYLIGR